MTAAPLSRNEPEERRRRIDAMKEAFARAIVERQAELHDQETPGRRVAWKALLLGKKSQGTDGPDTSLKEY
ncbi:hypothetical protein PZN02_003460 [Sinorhizobium garamanticum]|uniref:Transposase n=2 Tax=Sinorhizobium garamanticum TaxID=680247 RepID=A0ABY8DF86_9HYPH|nr:hypothetical protein [Sinorhizobium garamanticum]WEX89555.1 hypothetical protein PZN02_003460 [Sinorhizobium garamanticum]